MKPIIPSALLGALLVGVASAATTTPVGYETLSLQGGFNYLGVRLHESAVVSGTLDTVTTTKITDAAVDFGALLDDAKTYIIEINSATGGIQEVLGSAGVGSEITTTPGDLTGVASAGSSYTIREASTLSSIFGATNSAGLTAGFFGPGGADQVYLPNGAGFDIYFYDDGEGSWAQITGGSYTPVSGASIPIVYTDSLVVFANNPLSLVVDGEVKTEATNLSLASGFNYTGTVYPVGSTLASAFGGTGGNNPPTVDRGFFGPGGADLFYNPSGAGFDVYFFDDGEGSWAQITGGSYTVVSGAGVDLKPGLVIANENAAVNLVNSPPAFYINL